MKPWFAVFLLLAACSEDKTKIACDQGDPNACDTLAKLYAKRVGEICEQADASVCPHPAVVDAGSPAFVTTITLLKDDKMLVDGKPVADDAALLAVATDAHTKSPDIRAVIKADPTVPHGRIIHVLDTLKQAGMSKIAFDITPLENSK